MYPSRHSSVPSLPNVVFTVAGPTQPVPAGGQSGPVNPGFVQLPPNPHPFALQTSGRQQMRHISIPSQCYPATYLAARQPYGNSMIYGPSSAAGSPQTGVPYLKKRTVFPKHVTSKLRQWLKDNIENPFPDEEQKDQLCKETKLTLIQLNYWFINARRRVWPGLKDEVNKERAKNNLPPIQLPLPRRGKDNELLDQDDTDGDMMISEGDDVNPDDLEGSISLQNATAAQLKKVRKGSLSSSSDLSSSTTMTSTEEIPEARSTFVAGGFGLPYQTFCRPQSSGSTSSNDQLYRSSADNVSDLAGSGGDLSNGHGGQVTLRPAPQPREWRRRSPPGKEQPRLQQLQQYRHHQLDSNRLMRSAPCIYRPDGETQPAHYQSMPHIQRSFVMGDSQTAYMPAPAGQPMQAAGGKDEVQLQALAKPQYLAMVPARQGNMPVIATTGGTATSLSAANQL
eukprot:scpid48529/ scgid21889/ Homeobox protein meis3-A